MVNDALFLTFEGGEGSGKSTQQELFSEWFEDNYGQCVVTREPGGTKISEEVREVLLNPENNMMGYRSELLLYAASRAQHVEEFIIPNLEKGVSVLCDRFHDSTTVYQGFARGLDLGLINNLNNLALRECIPDLTFLIDIPVEEGLRNAGLRGKFDRMDQQTREFHERVRQGYLNLAKNDSKRFAVIPYEKGEEKVYSKIKEEFSKRYL